MKDDTSTPITDGSSPNDFERDKPGTSARTDAEGAIEELRQRGGVFVNAVRATRMPMALTDPNLPGNPIVFANEAFLKLSGYSMDEVLGQQPHFMNGPATDPKDARRFKEALRSDQDDIIETVQYGKNGRRFVATVLISAYKDERGHTLNHFMSWLDVTRRVEAEDEVADLKKAQNALRESEQKYAALFASSPAPILILRPNAPQFTIADVNDAYLAATMRTRENLLGRDMFDAFPDNPNDPTANGESALRASLEQAVISRRPHLMDVQKYDVMRPDGTFEERWWKPANSPVLDANGNVVAIIHHVADVTAEHRAVQALRKSERHAQVLLAELQHRVRNTLAIVRSIARRTAASTSSAEDMLAHFQGRLDAFSRVQAILTRNPDARVDLASLIKDELVAHATHEGDQVRLEGPPIALDAKMAERMSLAIHELTTNAVKHGALTSNRGRIEIRWSSDGSQLQLTWTECGLDLDREVPGREGFGMELLRRSLPYDLDGETEVELKRTGLEFRLRMPLRQ
jgi:PAS domain S-box-containing protein